MVHFQITLQGWVLPSLLLASVGALLALFPSLMRVLQAQVLHLRFFCDRCLCFGPQRFACGACGQPVGNMIGGQLHGARVPLPCPRCAGTPDAAIPARALCPGCGATSPLAESLRRVRLYGVVSSRALEVLDPFLPGPDQEAAGIRFRVARSDRETHYFVDLASAVGAGEGALPDTHALGELTAVWVDPEGAESPLLVELPRLLGTLGEHCAGFRRKARVLPIWIAAPDVPQGWRAAIEGHWGRVRAGVSLERLAADTSLLRAGRNPTPGA